MDNVDYAALMQNAALVSDFKSAVTGQVAAAAGVPGSWISHFLSDGSVNITTVIVAPANSTGVNMSDHHAQLSSAIASGNLTTAVQHALSQVEGISNVTSGSISVVVTSPPILGDPSSASIGDTANIPETIDGTTNIPETTFHDSLGAAGGVSNQSDGGGLSAGEIVLVVLLFVCFVLVALVVGYRYWRSSRRQPEGLSLTADPEAPKEAAPPVERRLSPTPETVQEELRFFHIGFTAEERQRASSAGLGVGLQRHGDFLIVRAVKENGLVWQWNKAREAEGLFNRAREVRVGDRIVQVNDTCGSALELESALQDDKHLTVRIRRPTREEWALQEMEDLAFLSSTSEPEVLRDATRQEPEPSSSAARGSASDGGESIISSLADADAGTKGNNKQNKMPRSVKIVPARQARLQPVVSFTPKSPLTDTGGSSPTWTL